MGVNFALEFTYSVSNKVRSFSSTDKSIESIGAYLRNFSDDDLFQGTRVRSIEIKAVLSVKQWVVPENSSQRFQFHPRAGLLGPLTAMQVKAAFVTSISSRQWRSQVHTIFTINRMANYKNYSRSFKSGGGTVKWWVLDFDRPFGPKNWVYSRFYKTLET